VEDLSILICTHGDSYWEQLAQTRAYPSAVGQGVPVMCWHSPDGTLASSRNDAARAASSRWLCFLDADDELDHGYVEAMRPHLSGDALLAPAVKYVDPSRATDPPHFPNEPGDMTKINRCVIGTLIRRETFLEVGGFGEWPCYEDWDLFLGAHLSGRPIVYVADAVYLARVSRGGRNAPTRDVAVRTMAEIKRKHGLRR